MLKDIATPEPKVGHVYIVAADAHGVFKIGFTRDVEKRVSQLKRGTPIPLRLFTSFRGSDVHEYALHNRMRGFRVKTGNQREWYHTTEASISHLKAVLQNGFSETYLHWANLRRVIRRARQTEKHAKRAQQARHDYAMRHRVKAPRWMSDVATMLDAYTEAVTEIKAKSIKHATYIAAFLNIHRQSQGALLTDAQYRYAVNIVDILSDLSDAQRGHFDGSWIEELSDKGCIKCGRGNSFQRCRCDDRLSRRRLSEALLFVYHGDYLRKKGMRAYGAKVADLCAELKIVRLQIKSVAA